MKRWLAVMMCLLTLGSAARAGAAAPGAYAREVEGALLSEGLQLQRDTTFVWGGLPLLEAEEDSALGSLLEALALRTRTMRAEDAGYWALDVLLQNVSVLDLSIYARDGVYYEQSSLLDGETAAFTPEEFSMFAGRLSSRSEGVLPANLDQLFAVIMRALGDMQSMSWPPQTADAVAGSLDEWKRSALTEAERLRPKLYIPGLYGLSARVTDVTRAEAIDLATRYADLLAENDSLWLDAARAQQPGAQEDTLSETARVIADTLRQFPQILAAWLPEDLPPAEYREVYGPGNALVVRQIEVTLPDDMYLYAEWGPDENGVAPLYVSLSIAGSTLEVLFTGDNGAPEQLGNDWFSQSNSRILQITYTQEALRLDVVGTVSQTIQTHAERETITTQSSWMAQSDALFGTDAVLTLAIETEDVAAGLSGAEYRREATSVIRLKGLGFDDQDILTLTARTAAGPASLPMPLEADAIRPALLDDATLDTWLDARSMSLVQAWYTILGRLPSDVAAYLLTQTSP